MQSRDEELFLRYTNEFNAIRIIDKSLLSTKWKLKADLLISEDIDDYKFNLILIKLKYFFEQILSDSILFSSSNEWALNSFAKEPTDNHIVLLPDEPVDDLIATVLQSKMNALGEGVVEFGGIDIESDNSNGVGFIFVGKGEDNLPNMEDWIGPRSYFSKPWWSRNDGSTVDSLPPEDADLSEVPEYARSLDFLKEALDIDPVQKAKIIKPEFKPVVIQGQKTEI
jgi:hypothetical protein